MRTILGIKLNNRNETSTIMQNILSKYGCVIKTRIGLHDVQDGICSPNGIILLEIISEEHVLQLQKELCTIEEIELQQMVFNCP